MPPGVRPLLRRIVLFVLLACATVSTVDAQEFCTTRTDTVFIARYDALLAARADAFRIVADTGIIHIPVTFHIQHSAGGPVVDGARLDVCLDATNAWYRDARVRFYRCGAFEAFDAGAHPVLVKRTVNIAVHWQADGCGSTVGTYVFVNAACERTLENIISHELGHVLGLAHTHGDSNLGTTDELVDGSNCTTAGDRLCDTPADPNLLRRMGEHCDYIGTELDANGMAYAPLTDNIMSYTNSECADSLTPMQLARARAVALALEFSCCPLAAPLARDTAICVGGSARLHAFSDAAEILWYEQPEGGMPVATGPLFTTPPLDSPRTWYVEAVDSCTSRRRAVTVAVLPATNVEVGGVQTIDSLDNAVDMSPRGICTIGERMFFAFDQGIWTTDGTAGSARMLLELPGGANGFLTEMVPFGNVLLVGSVPPSGDAVLYRIDAGSGETLLLGTFPKSLIQASFFLAAAESWAVFIRVRDSKDVEFWRTDGTPEGTKLFHVMALELVQGSFDFHALDDRMLFNASTAESGMELWCSDGTAEGTEMLADIWPGTQGSVPSEFHTLGDRMYFVASDSALGRELWVTDGTAGLIRPVTDINPGDGPSEVRHVAPIGDRLYFSATEFGSNFEPWVWDSVTEAAWKLGEINPLTGSAPMGFVPLGGYVYCCANNGSGYDLWKLEPSGIAPPERVKRINPNGSSYVFPPLIVWNQALHFMAHDGTHGSELWRSDGTEKGTEMVADIRAGKGEGSSPYGMTAMRGGLLFFAFPENENCDLFRLAPSRFRSCGGDRVLLVVHAAEGTVRWYEDEWSPDLVGVGAEWQTPPLEASRVYWAELAVGECRGRRVAVPVDVIAPPPMLRDTAVAPGTDLLLTADAASGSVEWYADSTATRHIGDGPTFSLGVVVSDTTVYARVREDDCVSDVRPLHVFARITGIQEEEMRQGAFARDVAVFPQPAHDLLELRLGADSGVEELVLLDILGRELRYLQVAPGTRRLQLPLGNLAPGPYLLLLRGPEGQRLLRIMRAP